MIKNNGDLFLFEYQLFDACFTIFYSSVLSEKFSAYLNFSDSDIKGWLRVIVEFSA